MSKEENTKKENTEKNNEEESNKELELKLKDIEEKNETEINKLININKNKEDRLKYLNESKEKLEKSFNDLKQKKDQIQALIDKKEQEKKNLLINIYNTKKNKNKIKLKKKSEEKKPLNNEEKELLNKQKIINKLSEENNLFKKSINDHLESNAKNSFFVELKKKENLKKKLEEEKKNLENIISKHKTECVKVIQDLEKQNGDIKIDLDSKREKLYKKKEDYFYIQSKFSLPKKEHEEYYKNLHNKKNFLDMKKHLYIINTEDELNKRLFEKSFQRMKILSDKIRLGDITNYMPTESQPIIDTNPEQKIISSLFSNSELESIKKIYEQESDNPSENFLKFKEKITKLEKGEALDRKSVV